MNLFPKWNARFVVRMGLIWGLLMAGLMDGVHHFFTPGTKFLPDFADYLTVFLAAGILYGILMWNMLEGAYRSYLSRQELESLDKLNARS
jgi:hypothetical protein